MIQLYFLLRFLHRIWRAILFGAFFTSFLVLFSSRDEEREYTTSTALYTGVISNPNTNVGDNETSRKYNNTFDNIIGLVKSKNLEEKAAIRLLAQTYIYGDPYKDNNYITADHFRQLLIKTPKDVLKLVNKSSIDTTITNLTRYKDKNTSNFIYKILNTKEPYFSTRAINAITVSRLSESDMITLEFTSSDPGITYQTIKIISAMLIKNYKEIQIKPSMDAVNYFKRQVAEAKKELEEKGKSLTDFNIKNKIINYGKQSEELAIRYAKIQTDYQEAIKNYYSSLELVNELEKRMSFQTKYFRTNRKFLQTLDSASFLTNIISKLEFNASSQIGADSLLEKYKTDLNKIEQDLKVNTEKMAESKYSKEGLSIDDFILKWVDQVLLNVESASQIKVYKELKDMLDRQIIELSPVGPVIDMKKGDILLTEQKYQTLLNNLTKMEFDQKNIEMLASHFTVVSSPEFPLAPKATKRKLFVLLSFFAGGLFIFGIFLIIEILDKTIRDKYKAKELSNGGNVIGAFPNKIEFRYRRYALEILRITTKSICNTLLDGFSTKKTMIINFFSENKLENKHLLAKNLVNYWNEQGFNAKYITFKKDFSVKDKKYFDAESIFDLYKTNKDRPEILVVIHPSIQNKPLQKQLIKNADKNIYIINSARAWKDNDTIHFNEIRDNAKKDSTFIILTNARMFAIEDFTGQLPPYTKIRNFSYRLMQLELVSEKYRNGY